MSSRTQVYLSATPKLNCLKFRSAQRNLRSSIFWQHQLSAHRNLCRDRNSLGASPKFLEKAFPRKQSKCFSVLHHLRLLETHLAPGIPRIINRRQNHWETSRDHFKMQTEQNSEALQATFPAAVNQWNSTQLCQSAPTEDSVPHH